ncbi:tryptophan 7-halogenase [Chloroflexi bacterium CFX3]|nr:tryptophan 7-halogenase [Chloroflexi bacterium CFX3]
MSHYALKIGARIVATPTLARATGGYFALTLVGKPNIERVSVGRATRSLPSL